MNSSDAVLALPSPRKRPRPAKIRAAITNGTCLHLGKVGAVSVAGRRFADLVRILSDELGGAETLSTERKSAIRAYAALVVERERMETALARGESFDAELYGQLVDRCDRLSRRMHKLPVKPARGADLAAHLARKSRP